MGERGHLGDGLEALVDHIQTAAVMRVVELANRLFSRLLQFLERRPLEEELTGQRRAEILAGQGQGLGKVTLERITEHVGEEGAQIDGAATMFQEARELACRRILWEQGGEFGAVVKKQLEADLRIGGIALGPAGLKGLAVACGGGRIDWVKDEEGVSHEGGDERAFGLLQAESDLPIGEALLQRGGPLGNGFGSVGKSGAF